MKNKSSSVYIGSGFDIGYPLALGARRIEMVDLIFEIPEARKKVKEIKDRKFKKLK
jgi:hypothetical protein